MTPKQIEILWKNKTEAPEIPRWFKLTDEEFEWLKNRQDVIVLETTEKNRDKSHPDFPHPFEIIMRYDFGYGMTPMEFFHPNFSNVRWGNIDCAVRNDVMNEILTARRNRYA
mgnify:CR=1 FL=1